MSYKNTVTVIIGFAGSGKSVLADQIKSRMNFESEYLFSRTNTCNEKSLAEIFNAQKTDAKEILIMIDEYRPFKSDTLEEIIMCHRYLKITLIIVVQHFSSIPTIVRDNAKNLIFMNYDPFMKFVQHTSNNFSKSFIKSVKTSCDWLKLPFAYCRITGKKIYSTLHDDETSSLFDKSQYQGKVTIVVGKSNSAIIDELKHKINDLSYTFDKNIKDSDINSLYDIIEEQSKLVLANNLEAKTNAINNLFNRLVAPGCVIHAKDKVKLACIDKNSAYLSSLDLSEDERLTLTSLHYNTSPIKNITIVLDCVDFVNSEILMKYIKGLANTANKYHMNVLISLNESAPMRKLHEIWNSYNVIVTDEQSLRTLVGGETYGNDGVLSVKKTFEDRTFVRFCCTTVESGL